MGVVSFINSWLKDLVILFVLISIAELVMPKGSLKRYIRLVIGFLVIFTIINPFVKLLKLDLNIDKVVFNYMKPDTFNMEFEDFYTKQEEQIEKIYTEKIMNDIGNLINEETEYELIDSNISIMKNNENYGEVENLVIYIREKSLDNKNGKIKIEKIEPVEINKNLDDKFIEDNTNENIKELISDKYGIEKEKINIKIYKKGLGGRDE
ncbi:MAG TPA: stage III sporulation protein AF [Tissierellaceae bacterium]|mgnify:CR=1 FL=1